MSAARVAILLVIGAVVAAVAVGCGSRPTDERAAKARSTVWASPAELRWLHRLGRFVVSLENSLDRAESIDTPRGIENGALPTGQQAAALTSALAQVRACPLSLRRVGPPPTPRLREPFELFRKACRAFELYARELSGATRTGDLTLVPLAAADNAEGEDLLFLADDRLPPSEVRSLPVIRGETDDSRIDPRFSRVATVLAHHRVEARCWSSPDWERLLREEKAYGVHHIDADTLGFAVVDEQRDNLAPEVCGNLVRLVYHHERPSDADVVEDLAAAVVTLAHEAQHSKGVGDEARAECYAIQLATGAAERLGVDRRYAERLSHVAWGHYDEELPQYQSAECRNGGAYDLHPASSEWP